MIILLSNATSFYPRFVDKLLVDDRKKVWRGQRVDIQSSIFKIYSYREWVALNVEIHKREFCDRPRGLLCALQRETARASNKGGRAPPWLNECCEG